MDEPTYSVIKPIQAEGDDTNVIEFKPKLITGGSSTPPTDNYLLAMKPGTIFIARDRMDRGNFMLLRFEVAAIDPKYVYLLVYSKELDETQPFGEVDPNRFINRFEHIETLHIPEEKDNE